MLTFLPQKMQKGFEKLITEAGQKIAKQRLINLEVKTSQLNLKKSALSAQSALAKKKL